MEKLDERLKNKASDLWPVKQFLNVKKSFQNFWAIICWKLSLGESDWAEIDVVENNRLPKSF